MAVKQRLVATTRNMFEKSTKRTVLLGGNSALSGGIFIVVRYSFQVMKSFFVAFPFSRDTLQEQSAPWKYLTNQTFARVTSHADSEIIKNAEE